MTYKVYILKSVNYQKTYTGIAGNIIRRLKEHNSGSSFYTKKYKPWKLIYSEDCKDRNAARLREKYFKSCVGRKKIRQILS
jgi:putative endonuclease